MSIGKSKADHSLRSALNFDADDLEANQRGELSPRQRRRFTLQVLGITITIVSIVSILIAVLLLIIAPSPVIDTTSGLQLLCGVGFILYIVLNQMAKLWRLALDLLAGQVAVVEQRIDIQEKPFARGNRALLSCGGYTFEMSMARALNFRRGDDYRLFFLPRSATLLSGQHLRDDES